MGQRGRPAGGMLVRVHTADGVAAVKRYIYPRDVEGKLRYFLGEFDVTDRLDTVSREVRAPETPSPPPDGSDGSKTPSPNAGVVPPPPPSHGDSTEHDDEVDFDEEKNRLLAEAVMHLADIKNVMKGVEYQMRGLNQRIELLGQRVREAAAASEQRRYADQMPKSSEPRVPKPGDGRHERF